MNSIIMDMNHVLEDLYINYLFKYISKEEISKDTWDMFAENIETHKYWLNEKYHDEIHLSAAYNDWEEYTLGPFIHAVEKTEILKFTKMGFITLYRVIMTDWHYAKEATPKTNAIYIHHIMNDFCLKEPNYPKWKKFLIKLRG
jgi:hypothetical protein